MKRYLALFILAMLVLGATMSCDQETPSTSPEKGPTLSEKSFSLPPLMTGNMLVYAVSGDIMEGYLTTTDSGGEIWFKIRDPHDDTVYVERFSVARHDFSITCKSSGFHTLLVSNPSSVDKNIYIQVRLQ